MSDWADEETKDLMAVIFHRDSNVSRYGKYAIASALRAAYERGDKAGYKQGKVEGLHHSAAKALRYAERELYDELTAAAKSLEDTP